jgi:hypothetical protein
MLFNDFYIPKTYFLQLIENFLAHCYRIILLRINCIMFMPAAQINKPQQLVKII